MRPYTAFTKKEFMEFTRTYKLLILGLVFLLFGIMSPLAAKFTPEIMGQFMPEGMEITMAEPTALDSWIQFSKNISQIGLFVVVILFSGIFASEYTKGTLIHILTKGLKRRTVILSKFTAAGALWTGAYLICFGTAFGYTWYYWGKSAWMPGQGLFIAALWLFGIFLIGVIVLGGVLFRNSYGCLLFAGGAVVIQFLLSMIPKVKEYIPLELVAQGTALLQEQIKAEDMIKPAVTAIAACVISIVCACAVFNKKKL